MRLSKLAVGLVGIAMLGSAQVARAQDQITVGYFLEWAMPFEYAKAQHLFEKEMGVKVNWRSFDTGTAISAAMASGDVQFGLSQGIAPFIVAASAGQDLQVVDVAVIYSGNTNCVISNRLDITKDNMKELNGKKAAVPIGTAAQYDFLKELQYYGVDTSTMQVVDMAPADGAAALAQGHVDVACGWGGALQRMEENGRVVMTAAKKDAVGLQDYDAITVPAEFAASQPDLVAKFLHVVHEMNDRWSTGAAAQKEMLPVIAKDAGMDLKAAQSMLKGFSFLDYKTMLSKDWLGGGIQKHLKDVADFFHSTGNIPKVRDSYDDAVNAGPLMTASKM